MARIQPTKTNRIQLVQALWNNYKNLPKEASLDQWCIVIHESFSKIGLRVYCHKSPPNTLEEYAKSKNEFSQLRDSEYHCDVQWDIAKLNRDTDDPSGANTDPLFPHPEKSIFYNNTIDKDVKCIDFNKLHEVQYTAEAIKNETFKS